MKRAVSVVVSALATEEGSGDEQQSKGEAASQHNDAPATDESESR